MKFHSFFRWLVILLSPTFLSHVGFAQREGIDSILAQQYFQEAQVLCQQDNAHLWGISLCGPMLFADRMTRLIVANQGDREGKMLPSGNIYIGKLPGNVNIANYATVWSGVHWTMIQWPLPTEKYQRASLMAHELWHRIQDQIGFPGSMPANNHLDSLEGRLWLQLEWRALQAALNGHGTARRREIKDALIFRLYRQSLFPAAASEERSLEMSEGLAQYTGVKLSGRSHFDESVASALQEAEKMESFVRSFAYASGPAYGILLDETGVAWRKNLKREDDLAVLLQASLSMKLPADIGREAKRRSVAYDGNELQVAETKRENARQRRMAMFRARFVEGPVLIVPLQKMNMQFDPDTVQPLDPLGTVYPEIRMVDVWGILNVSKGALMNPNFTRLFVPAPSNPEAHPFQGDGWTLELNPGWKLVPAERKGDFVLKKNE